MTFLQFWLVGTVFTTAFIAVTFTDTVEDVLSIRIIFMLLEICVCFLIWPIVLGYMFASQYRITEEIKKLNKRP